LYFIAKNSKYCCFDLNLSILFLYLFSSCSYFKKSKWHRSLPENLNTSYCTQQNCRQGRECWCCIIISVHAAGSFVPGLICNHRDDALSAPKEHQAKCNRRIQCRSSILWRLQSATKAWSFVWGVWGVSEGHSRKFATEGLNLEDHNILNWT